MVADEVTNIADVRIEAVARASSLDLFDFMSKSYHWEFAENGCLNNDYVTN
jgi:hypothetical protein